MTPTTQWWKRLRCDCFTDDIVRDDHEEFTQSLIPNKNDVSHVTESTAAESADWDDEDDILVHDVTTYESLPQQSLEKSFMMGMLAPTMASVPSSGGVLELVDTIKAKFMSSSEINYPPSQTGSSLVDQSTSQMPSASSWANIAAKLRARRTASNRPPPASSSNGRQPSPPSNPTTPEPDGPFLLGIQCPHPAYMMDYRSRHVPSTPPHKPRYFKTSSTVHHPQNEHVRIASVPKDDNKVVVRL